MKSGRYVLKPVEKESHGKREIDFYRKVTSSEDPVCLDLKTLIPEFYGTELLTWNESSKCSIIILILEKYKLYIFSRSQLYCPE